MKLLLLLIIIIIIIYVVSTWNSQPPNENNIVSTYEKFKTIITKKPKNPNIDNLIQSISNNYLDTNYKFNSISLPVTNSYASKMDNYYKYHLSNCIDNWNLDLNLNNLKLNDCKIIFVKETDNEFLVTFNAKLRYKNFTFYTQLKFYGVKERVEDFDDKEQECVLQLISIKRINDSDYNHVVKKLDPFISMDSQMAYVKKINEMHQLENIY